LGWGLLLITIITIITSELASQSFAQDGPNRAVDELFNRAYPRIKSELGKMPAREGVAVWRLEPDDKGAIDTRRLANRITMALMDDGLLKEMAVDFGEIKDKEGLRHAKEIYGVGLFVYGKDTTIEAGDVIKVTFQVFDPAKDAVVWEGVVKSREIGILIVNSTPPGAGVLIDGIRRGLTPFRGDVSAGEHAIRVEPSDPRYAPVERKMEVIADEADTVEIESFEIVKANVTVLANIQRSEVFLDGSKVGETDYTVRGVPYGEHRVEVFREGYTSHLETVRVASERSITVNARLRRAIMLKVDSDPSGASVYLNDRLLGKTPLNVTNGASKAGSTYALGSDFAQGGHTLRVAKGEGYDDWTDKVELRDGEETVLTASLVPWMGVLDVRSTPSAEILLNGISRGVSPLVIKDLRVGEYEVTLKPAGLGSDYQSYSGRVRIEKDKTASLDTALKCYLPLRVESNFFQWGTEVFIDDARKGETPSTGELTIYDLPAGEVTVRALRWGYKEALRKVSLGSGEGGRPLRIKLEEESWKSYGEWSMLLGGIAVGGGAIYAYFDWQDAQTKYLNERNDPKLIREYYDRAQLMGNLSVILGVLSGLSISGSITLFVF
jgi:hypothetical protein